MRANRRANGVYLYGTVALRRQFCPACKGDAIVLDGKLQCCDTPVAVARKYHRIAESQGKRAQPKKATREWLLHIQGNRCAYCGCVFGSYVENLRTLKLVQVQLAWDHAVPYSFLRANPASNWLAACRQCNGIKHDHMYDSLDEARQAIASRRATRGLPVHDLPDIADVFEVQGTGGGRSGGGPDKVPAEAWVRTHPEVL